MVTVENPEGWSYHRLDEVGEIISGGTPDSSNTEYWNGEILWAVPTDITKLKTNYITDTERKITKTGLEKSSAHILPTGTILITSRATIGECAITTKPISTNQGFQNLKCNTKYDNHFVFYSIKHNKNKLVQLASGSTFQEITKRQIGKILILIPDSLSEQSIIAQALSNIDELIEKLDNNITKKKNIKQGTMQELLTGKRRLSGFGKKRGTEQNSLNIIPEEWQITGVFDICRDIFLGLTTTVDYVESDGVPLIRANNISEGKLSFKNIRCISKKQHEFLTRFHKPKQGDVLVTKSGSLGICAIVDSSQEFSIYESIIVLQPNHDLLDSKFLLYFLRKNEVQNKLKSDTVGSTVGHINLTDFRKLKIPLPSFPEQSAISEVLSNMDAEIEELEKKRDKYIMIKNGMMQKLLTGEIRLQ